MAKVDSKGAAVQGQIVQDDPFAGYMPAGYSAEENRKIGGLTPIYAAKPAYDSKWAPCIGYAVCLEKIDMGEEIKDLKQRYRDFVRVEAKVATKAVLGKKGPDQKIVDIAVGDDVLMPLSGNIRNIKQLQAAMVDTKNVYLVCFAITGQMDVGQPTEMWVIDARINTKTIPRTGRYILPVEPPVLAGTNANSGVAHDRDGVVTSNQVQASA